MADEYESIGSTASANDAGAASTPSPEPSSTAGNGDAAAGVHEGEKTADVSDPQSQRESLIEAVLAKHPPKEDNDQDPIQPKTPTSGTEGTGRTPDAGTAQTTVADGKTGAESPDPASDKPISEDAKAAEWLTKEEMAALGPKARGRIEGLWKENREHRTFVDRAEPYLAPLREHQLPVDDVRIMAHLVGALNRGDYKTFYDAAKPYFEIASQALGITLPADIQQQVDEGEMTPEVGASLSQSRYKAATAEQQAQRVAKQMEYEHQARVNQYSQAVQADITQAVNDWETTQRSRDPDFSRLRPLIVDKMVAFVAQHGPPRHRQDALNLAEHARQEVLKAARPTPAGTRQATPRPGVNGSVKAPPRPEAKDVYQHVFNRMGL
jgi:hypothetical protein